MAKECFVCKKTVVSGNQVSHSNKHNKRVWKPNLQRVKVVIEGTPQRISVCTRCLRSGKVERA
ncbi:MULTISPECIES: 50S ribosomal protein L28 [Acetobacterium]|jgi:large subunit ribosomal protein L28|uniref:Large ribosomal subunit protein bL28 n=2 Tax=Acetobacterium TaxID=33951 RepID=A0A1F2PJ05_9FIRM|nr:MULTISPECIES: 50S ribosomal protein L28 [Acetobacterium]MBI4856881.1 50S ribosomal protein L28 [Acetobacterium woodii]MBP8866151.1 50S ribosomal protein L28 [Acetobacterium sp.]MBU4439921.1 50S ribosomal protein L28 [Bacillota bacterium]PKM48181.1 MAG: 50S ribosomal protein L28 [Firmicutes bacterium HGW-Firmicutes-6]MBC3898328.1 50S ribosomal protein L28 [Acetobacterium malicum]